MKIEKQYIQIIQDLHSRLEEVEKEINSKEEISSLWFKSYKDENEKVIKIKEIVNSIIDEDENNIRLKEILNICTKEF